MKRRKGAFHLFLIVAIFPIIVACGFVEAYLSPSEKQEFEEQRKMTLVASITQMANVLATNTQLAQENATEAAFQSMDATVEAEFQADAEATAQVMTATAEAKSTIDCSVFDGMEVEVAWPTWRKGDDLPITFKFPGGVPGLERDLPGVWHYEVGLGKDFKYGSQDCQYLGYYGKLHCHVPVPSDLSGSIQPLILVVEGCDDPVYYDRNAGMPFIQGNGGGDDHHDDHHHDDHHDG